MSAALPEMSIAADALRIGTSDAVNLLHIGERQMALRMLAQWAGDDGDAQGYILLPHSDAGFCLYRSELETFAGGEGLDPVAFFGWSLRLVNAAKIVARWPAVYMPGLLGAKGYIAALAVILETVGLDRAIQQALRWPPAPARLALLIDCGRDGCPVWKFSATSPDGTYREHWFAGVDESEHGGIHVDTVVFDLELSMNRLEVLRAIRAEVVTATEDIQPLAQDTRR